MNRILMVEEEINTVPKAQERLSHAGFEIYSAHDGRHALQIAKDKAPDLIITDAMIPVMSGIELCKAIKLDRDTRSIPIVVMTEKHRLEASFMFLGVKDFLNKPFSMDELESVVKNRLNDPQFAQLLKTRILINGRPEILSCCQQLIRSEPYWSGFFSSDNDTLLQNAIECVPDIILLDLLMPGMPADDLILKIRSIPELRNTVLLTYHTNATVSRDLYALQAQMIEVQYMKISTQVVGAREYLGIFNPVTFMSIINIYRKDFEVL